MNIQNTKIRHQGKDSVDAFGNWLKARAIAAFDNVRESFRQNRIQQEIAKNNRNRSMQARQQDILHDLPLVEKQGLGLYHLMD
jgi:hypothetical protein